MVAVKMTDDNRFYFVHRHIGEHILVDVICLQDIVRLVHATFNQYVMTTPFYIKA